MTILLGCGEGLLTLEQGWRALPCPLRGVSNIALTQGHIAALDGAGRELWLGGRIIPADGGVEAMTLQQGRCLTLSGDTDCLTAFDEATGERLLTTPAGVYPQDMCVVPGTELLAVCGGADGTVRLFTLPELRPVRTTRVPGNAQRVDAARGWLHVLCLTEDDGLKCLMCRIPLHCDAYDPIALLPGLPGAIRADPSGGLWTAASEKLYHFPPESRAPDQVLPGFGLIRHIDCRGSWALVTDPVLGALALVDGSGRQPARVLYEGDVGQGVFVE